MLGDLFDKESDAYKSLKKVNAIHRFYSGTMNGKPELRCLMANKFGDADGALWFSQVRNNS